MVVSLKKPNDTEYHCKNNIREATISEVFDPSIVNVYVMVCGAAVKIGISANPGRRFSQLKGSSFVKERPSDKLTVFKCFTPHVEIDAREVERRVHKIFARRRISGEWFAINPRDAEAEIIMVACLNMASARKRDPFERTYSLDDLIERVEFARRPYS